MEPVTSVLLDRTRESEGLGRMLGFSLFVHGAILAAVVLMPASWRSRTDHDALGPVMTISLGGAPGPQAGGMTPMGGRPIEAVTPLPDAGRPAAIRPPAAKTPAMIVPVPDRRAPLPPWAGAAPAQAVGRTPPDRTPEQPGSSAAETGARGAGFGLSTGGGGTGGYLDVVTFCCPEYLTTMLQLIQRNWNARQEVSGETLVKFTILRDGRLTDVQLEQSSGYAALDLTAQRAILVTRQLPPLPPAFTEDPLTVHLRFQYHR